MQSNVPVFSIHVPQSHCRTGENDHTHLREDIPFLIPRGFHRRPNKQRYPTINKTTNEIYQAEKELEIANIEEITNARSSASSLQISFAQE
jgi:hypothetical protein